MKKSKNTEKDTSVVCVTAIKAGRIVTSTSCDRKDAQHYAQYYRSIGYKARVMTYEELDEFEKKAETVFNPGLLFS